MSEEMKLWNGQKNKANICISLYGPRRTIQIRKDVVRVLGAPPYITFRVNQDLSSILIEAALEKTKISFKVPADLYLNDNRQMRVTSKSFVTGIMMTNGLVLDDCYHVEGVYSEKNNAVVFKLNTAEKYSFGEEEV